MAARVLSGHATGTPIERHTLEGGAMWCADYGCGRREMPAGAVEGDDLWATAGTASSIKPWSWSVTISGSVLGVVLFIAAFPLLLTFALTLTLLEALRHAFALDPYAMDSRAGADEDVTLVMPGVCGYVLWQLGMLHYLCERFDTRGAKLAGTSSGAVGAVFILALEEAASGAATGRDAAERVRHRAQGVFACAEQHLATVTKWPLGFLFHLGSVLDAVVAQFAPADAAVGHRVRVGLRRLSGW